jgi:hypothetical protein
MRQSYEVIMCEKVKQSYHYAGTYQITSVLDIMRFTLHPGVFTLTAEGCVGPTDNLDVLEKKQILGLCQESNRILQSSIRFTD